MNPIPPQTPQGGASPPKSPQGDFTTNAPSEGLLFSRSRKEAKAPSTNMGIGERWNRAHVVCIVRETGLGRVTSSPLRAEKGKVATRHTAPVPLPFDATVKTEINGGHPPAKRLIFTIAEDINCGHTVHGSEGDYSSPFESPNWYGADRQQR